jgi:hypothetical protein
MPCIEVQELQRLKALKMENSLLKKIVANQTLEIEMIMDVLSRKATRIRMALFLHNSRFFSALKGWALLGSNQRPPDYESGALTN